MPKGTRSPGGSTRGCTTPHISCPATSRSGSTSATSSGLHGRPTRFAASRRCASGRRPSSRPPTAPSQQGRVPESVMADSDVEAIAWRYWELLGEGRIDEAIELLDDDGIYWVNTIDQREERSMATMKRFLRTATTAVPMSFTKHDAMVDGEDRKSVV